MWPLAALIFFASVLMPVLKIVLLTLLLVGVQRGWTDGERLQQQSRSVITRALPAVGENGIVYDAIVVAMSEATGELAQTIAAAVRGARR
jgi:paraquat-inducible protein A